MFKCLFCKHIWKDERTEDLRRQAEYVWEVGKRVQTVNVIYYALFERCLKCEKIRVTEKSRTEL